jgi:hypothetical protein
MTDYDLKCFYLNTKSKCDDRILAVQISVSLARVRSAILKRSIPLVANIKKMVKGKATDP